METTKDSITSHIKKLNKDQANPSEIHDTIVSGIKPTGSPLVILFCAIIIASVGLSKNSQTTIIGAMLISPLVGTILAMGYSMAIYDLEILKKASISFLIQIFIALAGSTLYFWLIPSLAPNSELISRTHPSFYNFLIAFFGGSAGIIGLTRIDKPTLMPGVAIATALMTPLCTIGYGIANLNPQFIIGPLYLFAVNSFFILLSSFIFCNLFKLKPLSKPTEKKDHLIKIGIIVLVTVISVPALISASIYSYKSLKLDTIHKNLDNFISNEIDSTKTQTVTTEINTDENIIEIYTISQELTDEDIKLLNSKAENYNLDNYKIVFVQGVDTALSVYFQQNSK